MPQELQHVVKADLFILKLKLFAPTRNQK